MAALYHKVKRFIYGKKENQSLTTCEGQLTVCICVNAELKAFSKQEAN